MTPSQAKQILDRARDGELYPVAVVNRALFATGDIDQHELERVNGILCGVPGRGDASTQGQAQV